MTDIVPLDVLFTFDVVGAFNVSKGLVSLKTVSFNVVISSTIVVIRTIIARVGANRFSRPRIHTTCLTRYRGNKTTAPFTLARGRVSRRIRFSTSQVQRDTTFNRVVVVVMCVPLVALMKVRKGVFHPVTLAMFFTVLKTFVLSLACIPVTDSLVLDQGMRAQGAFSSHIVRGLRT